MKIGIISDAHLFQTFTECYDSIKDFESVINDVKKRVNPDMLFLVGDMFDYKKTPTIYVRHYEGEECMIKIRKILEKFGNPVFVIKGNHDREEILKGLEQTVNNFHYVKNDVKNFGDFSVCFMDSFYETGMYSTSTLEGIENFLKKSVSKLKEFKNTSILLCHETFAPYDNSISKSLIEFIIKNFDIVINGHMHMWETNAYNSKNVFCLPSLLPSKIAKGKYWIEEYEWKSEGKIFEIKKRESPFGYVVLDTETKKLEFYGFVPSKKIVGLTLETTNLSLEDSRKRFKILLQEVDKRDDKKDIIVLPELVGELSFLPLYLTDIIESFPTIFVENIKSDRTLFKSDLKTEVVSPPTLTIEQLYEKIEKDVSTLIDEIKKETNIKLGEKDLKTIIKTLIEEETIEKPASQLRTRLQSILSPALEVIGKGMEVKKPSAFEDNLTTLLKMVR
jgi:DNA repair exonuclease SbcCD nuclease subunit